MLRSLYIKNYALLDEVTVEFDKGLNIITGETGAGKSIIIDALSMILGEKADPAMIRKGAHKALVEGYFDVTKNEEVKRYLQEIEAETPAGEIILRREIYEDKRSRIFLNDSPVAHPLIKKLGDLLVDLHGQHQHQSLLKVEQHLDFIDDFGGLKGLVEKVRDGFNRLKELKAQLEEIKEKEKILREKRELLEFQRKEIIQVNPRPGEEEELEKEEKILQNSEKLYELTTGLFSMLYDSEGSVTERLSIAENQLDELTRIDESFEEMRRECGSVRIQIEELAQFLQRYSASIEFDPQRLEEVQERLGLLTRLKKKYGPSIEEVLRYKEKIEKDLELIENVEDRVEEIQKAIREEQIRFSEACQKLSLERRRVSKELEERVVRVLADLGMEKAKFEVRIENKEEEHGLVDLEGRRYWAGAKGMDLVEFYISTNPGEDPKPLSKVASGGEMSRIMLALKSILADKDKIPTLIFDEIDLGISGRIAQVVGKSLRNLASSHQIICITHLPQIASMANIHFSVEKQIQGDRTVTRVKKLNPPERVMEVAKLLGGERVTEAHLKSAQELLKEAENL